MSKSRLAAFQRGPGTWTRAKANPGLKGHLRAKQTPLAIGRIIFNQLKKWCCMIGKEALDCRSYDMHYSIYWLEARYKAFPIAHYVGCGPGVLHHYIP